MAKPELRPGIHVFNPRFSQSGAALSQGLLDAGFLPFSSPLFTIQPGCDLTRFQQTCFVKTHLIFTSQYAIEYGLADLSAAKLSELQSQSVYAIGQATAHYLKQLGFADVVVNAGHTSETLLSSIQLNPEYAVGIIKGEQGRNTLAVELANSGFSVDNYAVYKRCWSAVSAEHLADIAQLDAWIITSGDMLIKLMQQLDEYQLTPQADLLILVPSERVAQIAKSFAFTQVIDVKSASNHDMINALRRYYQNNNFKVEK